MRIFAKRTALAAATLLATAALAGCGNVSRNVAKNGMSAGELVWPAISDATPMHKNGTWPNLDSLRLVHAGQTKNQTAALIGYPHFSEGVLGVREWNYIFHFRTRDNPDLVCQYKVLFDDDMRSRSFYWHPDSCAKVLEVAKPAEKPVVEHFDLSADALFAFDKSGMQDIRPEGRVELNKLAKQLVDRGDKVSSVDIKGYTDRLGSDAYNQALSQKRAETVKAFLVEKGVSPGKVTAEGMGKADPIATDCGQRQRAALIACLQPNRRVGVTVTGTR